MPLPQLNTPTYELKLPSNGKTITVRPFTVRDEKLLLMALQGDDEIEIINATRQVVRNCIIDDIDIDKLPFFDLDYLFISLRAKSVGETINIRYTCHNTVDGHQCNASFPAAIDVSNVRVVKNPDIKDEITIANNMKVKMRYPAYHEYKSILDSTSILDKKIRLIACCVDRVIDRQKILTSKDFTPAELQTWLEAMTKADFQKFEDFVDDLPTFVVDAQAKCTRCGFEHKLEFTEFQELFV